MSRTDALLKCALMILDDACPPDREAYCCMRGEDDGDCCGECWRAYVFAVANGRRQLTPQPR